MLNKCESSMSAGMTGGKICRLGAVNLDDSTRIMMPNVKATVGIDFSSGLRRDGIAGVIGLKIIKRI